MLGVYVYNIVAQLFECAKIYRSFVDKGTRFARGVNHAPYGRNLLVVNVVTLKKFV